MPAGRDDPIGALNGVLSEVLDVVLVAVQADRKVPPSHSLHAELDRLVNDLHGWAALLMAEDDALGVSALTFMPSRAGRPAPNPWPTAPTDDQVRALLDELLGRLDEHLQAALADQPGGEMREILAGVERDLRGHVRALGSASERRPGT